MVYVIRGILIGRGSTLRVELETRQAAIRGAKELREEGFEVTITDPDGKPVDEASPATVGAKQLQRHHSGLDRLEHKAFARDCSRLRAKPIEPSNRPTVSGFTSRGNSSPRFRSFQIKQIRGLDQQPAHPRAIMIRTASTDSQEAVDALCYAPVGPATGRCHQLASNAI
jgi:hypothetical protein